MLGHHPTSRARTRLVMADQDNGVYWYSFTSGNEHTIAVGASAALTSVGAGLVSAVVISTEHNCSVGSPQYLWLAGVLAGVNRSATPWVRVCGDACVRSCAHRRVLRVPPPFRAGARIRTPPYGNLERARTCVLALAEAAPVQRSTRLPTPTSRRSRCTCVRRSR